MKGNDWVLGKVREKLSERAYVIQSQEGVEYRRNRAHIRPTKVNVQVRDISPDRQIMDIEDNIKPLHVASNKQSVQNESSKSDAKIIDEPAVKQQNVPTRPQRERRAPAYLKDFVR